MAKEETGQPSPEETNPQPIEETTPPAEHEPEHTFHQPTRKELERLGFDQDDPELDGDFPDDVGAEDDQPQEEKPKEGADEPKESGDSEQEGEEEESGEDDEEEEGEEESDEDEIPIPQSFNAEERERFLALPKETRQIVSRVMGEEQKYFTQKAQAFGELATFAENKDDAAVLSFVAKNPALKTFLGEFITHYVEGSQKNNNLTPEAALKTFKAPEQPAAEEISDEDMKTLQEISDLPHEQLVERIAESDDQGASIIKSIAKVASNLHGMEERITQKLASASTLQQEIQEDVSARDAVIKFSMTIPAERRDDLMPLVMREAYENSQEWDKEGLSIEQALQRAHERITARLKEKAARKEGSEAEKAKKKTSRRQHLPADQPTRQRPKTAQELEDEDLFDTWKEGGTDLDDDFK